jgi:hypothetical protein
VDPAGKTARDSGPAVNLLSFKEIEIKIPINFYAHANLFKLSSLIFEGDNKAPSVFF